MKIIHLCSSDYLDGWGYQDNLLPEYQAKQGHDVYVVAPANHFPPFVKKEEIDTISKKGLVYDYNNVHIVRVKTYLATSNQSFIYKGVYRALRRIRPDIIFQHNVAAPMLFKAAIYAARHRNVKLVVDNHADYINCSKNKLWFNIYIKGIERTIARLCSPYIVRAYGVTNLRCDYLHDVYGFPIEKIKLLPIGADTNLVNSIAINRDQLKQKYGYSISDIVIVSGGKMGHYKGTENLIEAFEDLKNSYPNLKLLLFGKFEDKETEQLANNIKDASVHGWCDRMKTIELLKMSDIACWPIHHTTLIEDAVACATPLVLRKTGNTEHLVIGNGELVANGSKDELVNAFSKIIENRDEYIAAARKLQEKYSYENIAKEVVNDCTL